MNPAPPILRFARLNAISIAQAEAYYEGKRDRKNNVPLQKLALRNYLTSWYAAGWQDKDMELGVRMI